MLWQGSTGKNETVNDAAGVSGDRSGNRRGILVLAAICDRRSAGEKSQGQGRWRSARRQGGARDSEADAGADRGGRDGGVRAQRPGPCAGKRRAAVRAVQGG